MSIPAQLLPTTCEVRRPFGAGSATYTNVPCRLVADFLRSRGTGGSGPFWTHYLVLNADADVRDGCTRLGGAFTVTYADGDEVRVPSGATTPSFVVVWVERVEVGTPREFQRAYLVRHAA